MRLRRETAFIAIASKALRTELLEKGNLDSMLSSHDGKILSAFAARVRAGHPEARIYAFGSRARGDSEPDSDFDVCVIVDEFSARTRAEISDLAWEVGFEHGIIITTVVFTRAEFETGPLSVSPLVRAIQEEGIAA